jgi:hypothetical protein
MSKWTRDLDADEADYDYMQSVHSVAAPSVILQYIRRVRELTAEVERLTKPEMAGELEWMGQAKDGRDLYAVKAMERKGGG